MNTRRSGTSVANVGQRRPQAQQPQNVANNFVPGGQLKPQTQPLIKMPANQQQPPAGQQKMQLQPQPALQQKIQPQTQQKTVAADIKPQVAPVRTANPLAQIPVKQESLIPVKQQVPPATPQQQQQVRPAGQQPVRPQCAVQMQKLTPQQQQAIKQQQAAKQPQTQPTAVKVAAAAVAPAPVCDIVAVAAKETAPPPLEMDGVVEGQEAVEVDAVKVEEPMVVDADAAKKKPRWLANKATFRITKADKLKRRNARFRKILQPKNALMILNEMNGSTQYTFVELGGQDGALKSIKHAGGFKAVTVVDGVEFTGTGVDKVTAKSNAAEAAIKSIILKKIISASTIAKQQAAAATVVANATPATDDTTTATDGDGATVAATVAAAIEDNNGDVDMSDGVGEVGAAAAAAGDVEGVEAEMVPWMHIASFALHKLFNSWEETGTLLRASSQGNLSSDLTDAIGGGGNAPFNPFAAQQPAAAGQPGPVYTPASQHPQRALPENAASMHPVMLLNQMRPGVTHYIELDVIGTPPSMLYSYECNVDGKGGYVGRGPNKKIARRNAGYVACQDVLSLTYSAEILSEIATSSEPRPMPQAPMRVQRNKQQILGVGGQGGYFVRQSQVQKQQQQMQQHQGGGGGGSGMNQQDLSAGDGYNAGGMDPGYQWY